MLGWAFDNCKSCIQAFKYMGSYYESTHAHRPNFPWLSQLAALQQHVFVLTTTWHTHQPRHGVAHPDPRAVAKACFGISWCQFDCNGLLRVIQTAPPASRQPAAPVVVLSCCLSVCRLNCCCWCWWAICNLGQSPRTGVQCDGLNQEDCCNKGHIVVHQRSSCLSAVLMKHMPGQGGLHSTSGFIQMHMSGKKTVRCCTFG
jgi:hypothetical protein